MDNNVIVTSFRTEFAKTSYFKIAATTSSLDPFFRNLAER